jgi:hypothetical protein
MVFARVRLDHEIYPEKINSKASEFICSGFTRGVGYSVAEGL